MLLKRFVAKSSTQIHGLFQMFQWVPYFHLIIRWNNACDLWSGRIWEARRGYSGLHNNYFYKLGVRYYIDILINYSTLVADYV